MSRYGTLCGATPRAQTRPRARRRATPAEETAHASTESNEHPVGHRLSAAVLGGQVRLVEALRPVWSVPRTPDGHPDFQGVWANNGMTPLERPKPFGPRATMTDADSRT